MYRMILVTMVVILSGSSMAADWSVRLGVGVGIHESVRPYCPTLVYRSYPFYRTPSVFVQFGTVGHYETITERVLVSEEHVERVFVEPVLETRVDPKGVRYSVVVQEGYYKDVVCPARYELVTRTIWVH